MKNFLLLSRSRQSLGLGRPCVPIIDPALPRGNCRAIFPTMSEPGEHSFWDTISEDAKAAGLVVNPHAPLLSRLWQLRRAVRYRQGFACVFWLRINQLLARRKWRGSFRLRIWRQYRFANDISEYASIGPGLLIPHPVNINIGSTSKLGGNVTLYNGTTLGSKRSGTSGGMPQLGDRVIVYTGSKIIGDVRIGDDVEIGAMSLCLKDVPSNSVMYGIPPNVTVKPKP